jgi:hypothetical protein
MSFNFLWFGRRQQRIPARFQEGAAPSGVQPVIAHVGPIALDSEPASIRAEPQLIAPEAPLPPPWTPAIGTGAYGCSEEHIWEELARVELLVRAQTLRWRRTIAAGKPPEWWGMVHIGDAEVDAYLRSGVCLQRGVPAELERDLVGYWLAATGVAGAIEARRAETSPPSLRLDRLQQLFHLSDLERDILLVCLLPELDGRFRRLYGYLQDDASRTRPTVELILQILQPLALTEPGTGRGAFAADAPLLAHHLVQIDGDARAEEPLSVRRVRLDDRIAGYLLGSDHPDGRLAGIAMRADGSVAWEDLIDEPEQVAQLQALAEWWRDRRGGGGAAIFLHGPYGSSRLAAARALCSAMETPLLLVDVDAALRAPDGWERIVDLSVREAVLQGAALYWAGCERLLERDQPVHRWDYLVAAVERSPGLTFLAGESAWDPAGRFRSIPFVRFDFPMPSYPIRRRLWERHLPAADELADGAPPRDQLAEMLANSFQLTDGQIEDAVASARWQAARRDPCAPRPAVADLFDGCRRQSSRRLSAFARRIEPRTRLTFDDLILPPASTRQLEELRARIRHRGQLFSSLGLEQRLTTSRGVVALFTGSSGTGKTMAAELLAREQGVDLYKVDLAAVTSKWVGETEKNLNQLFAEAEDSNAIIFFDEAEAIFGKREQVKDAQDRWANMEVNYLLQRVEEYAGVVILASNLRQNIDEAFLRRINVTVQFDFPEPPARFRIWRGAFPAGVARPADADLRGMAERFPLSGGNITNVVVDACFRALAAAGGGAPTVTLRHLVAATAREYEKLGKPITRGEFGEQFYTWVQADILLGDNRPEGR